MIANDISIHYMLWCSIIQYILSLYRAIESGLKFYKFLDPRFKGMEPLFCIYLNGVYVALIQLGQYYALPFLHHFGDQTIDDVDWAHPKRCNCSSVSRDSDTCNDYSFVAQLLIFPIGDHPDDVFQETVMVTPSLFL